MTWFDKKGRLRSNAGRVIDADPTSFDQKPTAPAQDWAMSEASALLFALGLRDRNSEPRPDDTALVLSALFNAAWTRREEAAQVLMARIGELTTLQEISPKVGDAVARHELAQAVDKIRALRGKERS